MVKKREPVDDKTFLQLLFADESRSAIADEPDGSPAERLALESRMRTLGLPEWWIEGRRSPTDVTEEMKVVPIIRGRRAATGNFPTLPSYLAPGEKRRMAAKRATRPPQALGYLRLEDGGSLEIGSDDVAVFAKFSRGQQSSAIEIGSAQHELRPSKTYFGYFEVQNLTPEKASELIQWQREAPDECIVSRINT